MGNLAALIEQGKKAEENLVNKAQQENPAVAKITESAPEEKLQEVTEPANTQLSEKVESGNGEKKSLDDLFTTKPSSNVKFNEADVMRLPKNLNNICRILAETYGITAFSVLTLIMEDFCRQHKKEITKIVSDKAKQNIDSCKML